MKKENSELQTVFSWLEEYSQLNTKQKDGFSSVKVSESLEKDPTATRHPNSLTVSMSRKMTLLDSEEELFIKREDIKYINFSEDAISTIEDPSFDIFILESEVGQDNILSTISCYLFTTLGFYSLIKYDKFEGFIQEIAKGYIRANPYHTV